MSQNFWYPSTSSSAVGTIDVNIADINGVPPGLSNPLPVRQTGNPQSQLIRNDYSINNANSTTYIQLVAATSFTSQALTLFDSSGYAMQLGIGGAGVETPLLLIPPGGLNGAIPLQIPLNSRISVKAIGAATVNLGEIDINLLG